MTIVFDSKAFLAKNLMSEPSKIKQHDLLERINFLANAASTAAQFPEMSHFSQTDPFVISKSVQTRPKRMICKKCSTPLVPPFYADVLVTDYHIIYECNLCHAKRMVPMSQREVTPKFPNWIFFQKRNENGMETIVQTSQKA